MKQKNKEEEEEKGNKHKTKKHVIKIEWNIEKLKNQNTLIY